MKWPGGADSRRTREVPGARGTVASKIRAQPVEGAWGALGRGRGPSAGRGGKHLCLAHGDRSLGLLG